MRGMKPLIRLGLTLANRVPPALAVAYRVLRVLLDRSPDRFLALMTVGKPKVDLDLIAEPSIHSRLQGMLQEATRNGVLGAVQEAGIIARPWGFSLAAIRCPVELWHGEDDDTAPLSHALRLRDAIPGCRLHVLPGESHMVMWTHLADMLAFLKDGDAPAAAS